MSILDKIMWGVMCALIVGLVLAPIFANPIMWN